MYVMWIGVSEEVCVRKHHSALTLKTSFLQVYVVHMTMEALKRILSATICCAYLESLRTKHT